MMWEATTLGRVSESIQTGPFGSQLHQSDYADNGTPVVMPKDLVAGKIVTDSIARIPIQLVEILNRHKIKPGDIIYSRRGDVGRSAYASEVETDWICGTGCLRVTINQDQAVPKYVFYQLQSADCVGWVEKHAIGATMLNLNTSILSQVPITIPPLPTQERIASILSAYDSLIETNRRQIKLLEEAAQRIYKEWFVDLRFPGWEETKIVDGTPEGWRWETLDKVFRFIRGKSYTSNELCDKDGTLLVNLKNIRPFGGYNRNAEKRFIGTFKIDQELRPGDIIMGVTDMTKERRLVGRVALVPDLGEKMTFSMDLIKLIPMSVLNSFLYGTMFFGGLSYNVSALANGVNVLHLKPESMMNLKMIIPTYEIMKRYDFIFSSIHANIEILQEQCNFSKESRDRLLPKLMTGEIEV